MPNKPTHVATMTISSTDNAPNFQVRIKWDPDLEGVDINELGYLPAAYEFVQEYMLPALEEAFMHAEHPELYEDPPSSALN